MRVMCVSKDTPGNHPDLIIAAAMLEVGSIYNLVDEDEERYELAEFPHSLQIMWDKIHFIKLPRKRAKAKTIVNLQPA